MPRGLAPLLRRRGFESVRGLDIGERMAVGTLEVIATPANHSGSRALLGPRAQAIGFTVAGSKRILFLGDTGLHDRIAPEGEQLDLALVPIWGWGPTLGRGRHLDPVAAAEVVRRLRPRVAIPIHWGTFRPLYTRARGFLTEPAAEFATAAAHTAPDVDVRVLRPGETTVVP